MNILKIKFILTSITAILILTSLSYNSNAQTFIDKPWGKILKSGAGWGAGFNFRNSSMEDFGGIYGMKTDGIIRTEIRDFGNDARITIKNKFVGINELEPKAELHAGGLSLFGNVDRTDVNGVDLSDRYSIVVEKGILTEKCKVAVKSTNFWADYVFEEDYEMMEIEELEDYVTENKHLPNVPSAEEVVANGLDVATMDAKLLEKIEEAYLYIIDLNKKVDALATENESLKTSLQGLTTSGN